MTPTRRAIAAAALALADPRPAWAAPQPYVLYGCQPGAETLDEGHGGGNPFASALIELLAEPDLPLGRLPGELRRRASEKSEAFQLADVPADVRPADLRLTDPALRRVALVTIRSAYRHPQVARLPGAARDGARVAAALREAGFAVTDLPDPETAALTSALDAFAAASRTADVAVVYATGHGVQSHGITRLLATDYRPGLGEARLPGQSVTIPRLAAAAQARRVNLAFWAGCRSPFLV